MAHPLNTTDGNALIPAAVAAALGATTFKQATKELSQEGKDRLSRAIGRDVDEWRADFAQQLRETGQELLTLTRRDLALIKPDARAYTLAVLIDKASALEGRNSLTNASVNIQVNNYGLAPRDALMGELDGMTRVSGKGEGMASNQPQTETSGD